MNELATGGPTVAARDERLRVAEWLPAAWTVAALTVRRYLGGMRLVVSIGIFLLPALFIAIAHLVNWINGSTIPNPIARDIERIVLFNVFPHALLPLAALIYCSSMIQDEIEEQTLTYLLIRPLPRWTIYAAKWLAVFAVVSLLAAICAQLTYLTLYFRDDTLLNATTVRSFKAATLFALLLFVWTSLFGLMSLYFKQSFVVGFVYVIAVEGILPGFSFSIRELTAVYHFRLLVVRWLGDETLPRAWSLDLTTAPEWWWSAGQLIVIAITAMALAGWSFGTREFRVKTPGG